MQAICKQSWRVQSLSGSNPSGYIITQLEKTCNVCSESSLTVCLQHECGFLCRHMYKCDPSCYDYNNGHICKHVHKVHSVARSHSVQHATPDPEYQDDTSDEEMDYLSYAEPVQNSQKGIDT